MYRRPAVFVLCARSSYRHQARARIEEFTPSQIDNFPAAGGTSPISIGPELIPACLDEALSSNSSPRVRPLSPGVIVHRDCSRRDHSRPFTDHHRDERGINRLTETRKRSTNIRISEDRVFPFPHNSVTRYFLRTRRNTPRRIFDDL